MRTQRGLDALADCASVPTDPALFARLGDVLDRITRAAGREILEVYRGSVVAEYKDDDSPITAADRRAHALIVRELQELAPRIPIISEESTQSHAPSRLAAPCCWLVDPLDGTKEFIAKNGEFTVNVALVRDGRPLIGVVHVPVDDTTYVGAVGYGAWRTDVRGARTDLNVRRPAGSTVRVLGSRSHGDAKTLEYAARLGAHEFVAAGSSLKFCRIADGDADVYPRFGPTSEWDTAAGHAVVVAAGGGVLDHARRELRYNRRESLLNPPFLAFGDAARDWHAALSTAAEPDAGPRP